MDSIKTPEEATTSKVMTVLVMMVVAAILFVIIQGVGMSGSSSDGVNAPLDEIAFNTFDIHIAVPERNFNRSFDSVPLSLLPYEGVRIEDESYVPHDGEPALYMYPTVSPLSEKSKIYLIPFSLEDGKRKQAYLGTFVLQGKEKLDLVRYVVVSDDTEWIRLLGTQQKGNDTSVVTYEYPASRTSDSFLMASFAVDSKGEINRE